MFSGGGLQREVTRFTKFITVDVSAVDWLATVVGFCSALAGPSDFYKSRRKSSTVSPAML